MNLCQDIGELNRIQYGGKFYVIYYYEKIYGHCWLLPTSEGLYIQNLFCRKPTSLRKIWVADVMYIVLRDYSYGIITADVNEFNRRTIVNGAKELGFIEK